MKYQQLKRLLVCTSLVFVLCFSCVFVFVSAQSQTLYVNPLLGSDSNAGTSTSKPYKTLDKALSNVGALDTTIVLMRDTTISADYEEPEHTGKVTITSGSYGSTIKFTSSSTSIYRLNGNTTFENVKISMKSYVVFAAQFNPIKFGSSVTIANGAKYGFIVGGYEAPAKGLAASLDSSITVDSGSFYRICGFSRTKGEIGYTFTGTANITINGGSVNEVYGASLYNHYSGSANITVNGGSVTSLYAGGDVTRRLDGNALIDINGGTVSKIDVNNVIGNATVNLNGACPQSISVSYENDTIKTLAEKAGSSKTVNYNAIYCPESVVSTLSSSFDVVNNATALYVSDSGNGNGSTVDAPMSSFAEAYEKISKYGGTLYIVGTSTVDRKTVNESFTQPLAVKGYSSAAVINIPDGGSLDLYANTTISSLNLKTSGSAAVCSHAGDITIGKSVTCSGSISLYAQTNEGADSVCNIASGKFAYVSGSSASSAGSVTVNMTGGSAGTLVGADGKAKNVRIETAGGAVTSLYASKGTVSGNTTVKLAQGSISNFVAANTTGKTILSIASASVSSFDNTALTSSGESVLVLGRGASETEFSSILSDYDTVKHENTVYIADGGTGNGISALTPTSNINTAIKNLGKAGKVVVSGNFSTPEEASLIINTVSYPITITSVDEDNDYRARAVFNMRGNLRLGGETIIEDLRFECPFNNAFIYAYEHKLTIGEGVDTTLTNANTNYITISGGRLDNNGNGDADITVNSGNWGKFRGGSVKTGTVSSTDSKINLTVNGGIFHGYFICGSRGNVRGDINLTVNGGTFMQGIYGVYEEDSTVYDAYFDYDMVFNINGGNIYAEISPARSKDTELHGTYTVNLNGGEFERLTDLRGAEEYAGNMKSVLNVGENVNIDLAEVGYVSHTNFLRRNNADPWLFYYDGFYYYTCTGATSISLIKTANIADIKTASSQVILTPNDGGVNMWSPEIHYFTEEEAGKGNAGWYLFIGHDDGTTANQRQYVAKCLDGDDLMGRWGNPVTGEVNSLQKVSFPDSPETNETALCGGMSVMKINGKTYLTFVSEVGRGTADFHQTINITEFENPWTMKGVPTVICEPEYEWEAGGSGYSDALGTWYPKVVEGASAVYSDSGDVYLMYTGSGYWTIYYQLGYLKFTGTDPLQRSSWTKNPTPVFSLSDDINGCGHASYFKDHNGDYWACYHAYIGKDTSSKRFSFAERIYVTSSGISVGNGSGHPAPLDTVYTLTVNPMPLRKKISEFASVNVSTMKVIITTPEQLIELMNDSSMWNAEIMLGADIDLSKYTGELSQASIGNVEVPFIGSFDGCGYTIRGINITASVNAGLFGRVAGGAYIGNFTAYGNVKNSSAATSAEWFFNESEYNSTGGVVGMLLSGSVENVVSYVNVSANGNAGGLIGMIYITDENTASVSNCQNYGTVTNKYGNTGGLIGRIQTVGTKPLAVTVSGCKNYADVTSTSSDRCRVGGIVGYIRTETQGIVISKCENYGDISGKNTQTSTNNIPHIGGIAGRVEITSGASASVNIEDCKNEGDITTNVRGGGIVGIVTRSATCTAESGIYRCENRGAVIGIYAASTVQIGGIAGYIDNNCDTLNFVVCDCVNYASVSCTDGKGYVGGIIGGQDSTDLYRCVNYGVCAGHSTGYTGAITGVEVNDGKYGIYNCYALDGTASKLYGYSRSAYCTEKSNAFVSAQNKGEFGSYATFDFDGTWLIRDGGVMLRLFAPTLAGDADGDMYLTNSDITVLIRYLSGWSTEYDMSICDMNSDGILNNRDAIALITKYSK